ncbi:MAG: 2-dehydropantoate 2-reductase [Desulfobacterales bacterium]
MSEQRLAVIGIGATGTVLAATLMRQLPDVFLMGRSPDLGKTLKNRGLHISGEITCNVAVEHYSSQIADLKKFRPAAIFLTTKAFHLEQVLNDLRDVFEPGMKIIACQNGLGPEDLVADRFGRESALRMSLNYGASLNKAGDVEVTFFNRPNHMGGLSPQNANFGAQLANTLTDCGLDTAFVDDIKLFVWKKMVMKCTMASICAVTGQTIKEALQYPPSREIADACFQEVLAVAKSMGYDLGENYLQQALAYLEKVGIHKDSMCNDIDNKAPTEIDFLGAKVVDYARANGLATPFYVTMTNLVKSIESRYLNH